MRESRPLSKSAGTNKTTEWSGSGRVVACIAVRLRRGRRDLSAWRRAGAPLAGVRRRPKRGLVSPRAGRCEPGGNGPAHAQASKAVLFVDRIYRSKDTAFPRKRC
jgi:hypothetical protein